MRRLKPNFTIGRRRFLQLAVGGLLYWTAARRPAQAATYTVGVGRNSDGYAATIRALEACGEWNATFLAGRKVLVKPNLVVARAAETGATTDPQVVRAIVDTALAHGAAAVSIIESFVGSNNFESCGYGFFATYDPGGRVSLVRLETLPVKLVHVPNGLVYQQIYMPEMLFDADTLLVSAAKMKVHIETLVTLSVKNVFGLSAEVHYREQTPKAVGRFAMHNRGVQQAIVDHNLVRPIDFAVVDGVWAMERAGPFAGDPVPFNSVLAGRNAVAVDGVCLAAMGIPQRWVHYLTLASSKGLGPSNLAGIEVRGDSLKPRVFQLPDIPPTIDLPIANPATFQPSQGQITRVRYGVSRPSYTRIDVVKTSDLHSAVTQVRLLQDWTLRSAGHHVFEWDGRDSQGNLVEPGTYTVRVEATHGEVARNAFASSWVRVVDGASSSGVFQLEPSVLTFVGAVDSASPPAQTVIVNDFKGDALEWNVTSSSAWITLSPTSGTTPSAVTVEVSSVGLNAGVYMGEVTIVNAGTEAILQTVSVQFTVEPRTHKLLLPHALRP